MPPYFPRTPLRFERTADAAFRTARYADPIEGPHRLPFWRRFLIALKRRFG